MTPYSEITPRSFNDVQVIADHFIAGRFVAINLQGVDVELSRRIMDFASGVCYGLGGSMEKVDSQVYQMAPLK
ncbi:MAG: cell division protein SepF [Acidimicrobiales bacterium]|nr:cell division protein SepF [Acidimicrobiales bacterium]